MNNKQPSALIPGPDCARFAPLLPLLNSGALEPDETRAISDHLARCARCQQQVREYETMGAAMRERFSIAPAARPLVSMDDILARTGTLYHRAPQRSHVHLNPPISLFSSQRSACASAAPQSFSSAREKQHKKSQGEMPMFMGRIKTIAAVVTIAAVIALFAVLFYGFTGHGSRTAANPTSTHPATPTCQATPHTYDAYVPAVAPSDPRVVYKLVPAEGASSRIVLARTTDCGATWKTFAVPAKTSDVASPYVVVSPLHARVVMLITIPTSYPLSAADPTASCPQSQASSGSVNSFGTFSGGQIPCPVVYVSQDDGAHWAKAHLPQAGGSVPAAIGPTITGFGVGSTIDSPAMLRAQGNRLYSAMGVIPARDQSPGFGGITVRLITSSDGGLTWSFADTSLPVGDGGICDYSPAPTGSTIFAIVSNHGCGVPESAPTLSLWRSDDAGAHWATVNQLPGNVEMGMIATSRAQGQDPLLYIDMAQATCTIGAYLSKPNAGGCGLDASPTDVQVSADGGKTWTAAPTTGFANPKQDPGAPLGVLQDGSVLFLSNDSFFTWKLGDASWHPIGQPFSAVRSAFVVPGTQNTVCVVTGSASGYVVQTFSV